MIAYDNIKMILGFYLLCPFMWLTVIKLSMSPLVPNKKALHPKAKGLFLSFRLLLTYIVTTIGRPKSDTEFICAQKTGTPPFQEEVPGIFNPVILLLHHHSPVWEPNRDIFHVMKNGPLNTPNPQQNSLIYRE